MDLKQLKQLKQAVANYWKQHDALEQRREEISATIVIEHAIYKVGDEFTIPHYRETTNGYVVHAGQHNGKRCAVDQVFGVVREERCEVIYTVSVLRKDGKPGAHTATVTQFIDLDDDSAEVAEEQESNYNRMIGESLRRY